MTESITFPQTAYVGGNKRLKNKNNNSHHILQWNRLMQHGNHALHHHFHNHSCILTIDILSHSGNHGTAHYISCHGFCAHWGLPLVTILLTWETKTKGYERNIYTKWFWLCTIIQKLCASMAKYCKQIRACLRNYYYIFRC